MQLALDTSAIASVTQILIYSIATDDYVSFKLSIVIVFVPDFCFELRRMSHYCTRSSHA